MDDNHLFSVLIANYNNGRYLMEAIESVYAQTYTNWEIVIVDDASTDNSFLLYKQLEKDSRIHVYYNEKNMGCAYTKHRLMLYAKGEYCGYLDPDDVILPNALEVTMKALTASPSIVLSFSRHYICDEFLNVLKTSRLLVMNEKESYFEHHDYQAEVFAGFRKDAYFESGGLDVTNLAGVDADLYFRLEEQGEIAIINEFTYKYRRQPRAITANVDRMMYWNLMIRHNTCLRRGLPVEEYPLQDFMNYIQMRVDLKLSQNEQALSSKAYKIGKMLLKPFSIFKH
jgi:glycosyltransferase involved in cell wall biosynthesis